MSNKPYWHETIKTDEDFGALCETGLTIQDVLDNYKQPDWCNYPDALEGQNGCWSLWYLKVTGRDYCKTCECSADSVLKNDEDKGK